MLTETEIRNQLKHSQNHVLFDKSSKMQFSYSIVNINKKSNKVEVYRDIKSGNKVVKRVLLHEYICNDLKSAKFYNNLSNAINLYVKNEAKK